MGSEDTPMESALGEIVSLVSMKVQTKSTECFGMLIKKSHVDLLGPATKVGEELMGIPSLTPRLF
jgi:hypothetical protein